MSATENMITPELLALAANEDVAERDSKPPGVRIGDILSNGWATNSNPNKLFMYLGVSTAGDFRGINIEGHRAGPEVRGNRTVLVLPRDTPHLWRIWEELAKALPLVPDKPYEECIAAEGAGQKGGTC